MFPRRLALLALVLLVPGFGACEQSDREWPPLLRPGRERAWVGAVALHVPERLAGVTGGLGDVPITPPLMPWGRPLVDTTKLPDGRHTLVLSARAPGGDASEATYEVEVANGPAARFPGRFRDLPQTLVLSPQPKDWRISPRNGAVAADFDGDGDLDVFAWDRNRGRLHRQVRPLEFVASDATFERVVAAGAADLDGDGLPELVSAGTPVRILRFENGELVDVSARAGIDLASIDVVEGVTFTDLDADGLLDVMLGRMTCSGKDGRAWVLRNEGDLVFRDVTRELSLEFPDAAMFGFAADRPLEDGPLHVWPMFEGCRPMPFGLRRFEPSAAHAQLVDERAPKDQVAIMGSAYFDADADGNVDLFVSGSDSNPVYRGPEFMENIAPHVGLDAMPDRDGHSVEQWAVALLDADLDARPDLFVTQGHWMMDLEDRLHPRTRLMWQAAPGRFREAGADASLDLEGNCRAAHPADLDGDGDADLLLGCLWGFHLLVNDAAPKDAGRTVLLRGTVSNPSGVDAWLVAPTGERRLVRGGGQPFAGGVVHESVRAPAGELVVRWPSGLVQSVPVGDEPVLRVTEPEVVRLERRRVRAGDPAGVEVVVRPPKDGSGDVSVSIDGAGWETPLRRVDGGAWRGRIAVPASPGDVRLTVTVGGETLRVRPRVYVR